MFTFGRCSPALKSIISIFNLFMFGVQVWWSLETVLGALKLFSGLFHLYFLLDSHPVRNLAWFLLPSPCWRGCDGAAVLGVPALRPGEPDPHQLHSTRGKNHVFPHVTKRVVLCWDLAEDAVATRPSRVLGMLHTLGMAVSFWEGPFCPCSVSGLEAFGPAEELKVVTGASFGGGMLRFLLIK